MADEFPPDGPTTLTLTIPSYLYKQYQGDDNLQAFVDAFNTLSQEIVDWFVNTPLPVYTSPAINGALLDFSAAGIYGMYRQPLPSGSNLDVGPLNTYEMDGLALDDGRRVGPTEFFDTTDDIFKRILTWHLWKGDGKIFNIRWLKRRVMRFLTGTDGGPGDTDATYQVSVTFGAGNDVNINLRSVYIVANDDGSILNGGTMDGFVLNSGTFETFVIPVSPLVPIFKAAMDAGILSFPFQFHAVVNTDS